MPRDGINLNFLMFHSVILNFFFFFFTFPHFLIPLFLPHLTLSPSPTKNEDLPADKRGANPSSKSWDIFHIRSHFSYKIFTGFMREGWRKNLPDHAKQSTVKQRYWFYLCLGVGGCVVIKVSSVRLFLSPAVTKKVISRKRRSITCSVSILCECINTENWI